MKVQEVKDRMKEKKIKPVDMATEMGMDVSTYYRKLRNEGAGFSAIDVSVMKRVLDLDDATAVDILLQ